MVKHTQTIRRNCLSVFDHFVGLALKELISVKNLHIITVQTWLDISI